MQPDVRSVDVISHAREEGQVVQRRANGALGFLHDELTAPVSAWLLPAFRVFFSVHIFLQTLKLHWRYDSEYLPLVIGGVLVAAIMASTRGWVRQAGLLGLIAYKGFHVVSGFPMTGNHPYVELLILLVLFLFTDRQAGTGKGREADGLACHLIQLTILSIYFFAGLHKLIHGYWLSGEYLGQALYTPSSTGLWTSVQWLLQRAADITGASIAGMPFEQSAGLGRAPVFVPAWTLPVLLALSWGAVVSELTVPVLTVLPRTRRLGIWLFMGTVLFIGALSWETEFMFASLGCILLFFNQKPVRNYAILLGLHIAWSLFVVLADLRVWVM